MGCTSSTGGESSPVPAHDAMQGVLSFLQRTTTSRRSHRKRTHVQGKGEVGVALRGVV